MLLSDISMTLWKQEEDSIAWDAATFVFVVYFDVFRAACSMTYNADLSKHLIN